MPSRDGKPARNRLVLTFDSRDKELVLNATNQGFLTARLGDQPNSWLGAEIILHRTTTVFGNDTVPAFRIIDVRGGADPVPPPDDDVPF